MKSKFAALAVVPLVGLVACVHSASEPGADPSSPKRPTDEKSLSYHADDAPSGDEREARSVASATTASGYKLTADTCGQGPLKFPRVAIDMRKGYCAGLVASSDDGLKAPRTILQVPKSPHFVVVDFGAWKPRYQGRVLLLEKVGATFKLKTLLSDLDFPHGSAVGPDGKVYVATSETIFRFDPLAKDPQKSMETIVRGLPGTDYAMPDGRTVKGSTHPLKSFVFDKTGAIYVNVGAPSDACLSTISPDGGCFVSESGRAAGAIWKITPQSGRVFKALGPSDPNPPMKVFARGLRNSIALVLHPSYPDLGAALLQGENSRDFKDPSQPNEELNAVVEGRHYGWPYCFNNESTSPEFDGYMMANELYRGLCVNQGKIRYERPYTLLPPHVAPLDLKYYTGSRFPELKGTLLMSWHGYASAGHRLVFARVDAKGFPIKNSQAIQYNRSCDASRPIETAESKTIDGVQFEELVTGWHEFGGTRPRGAPVGMAVADDGAIWVVEDKNATILRIDATNEPAPKPLPCDGRTEDEIRELFDFAKANSETRALVTELRKNLVQKHCISCHTGFNLKESMTEDEKDATAFRYVLEKDSWFFPGNTKQSRIHLRTNALGSGLPMPPNAPQLLATDKSYVEAVGQLAKLIRTLVPGRIRVVTVNGAANVRNRQNQVCGTLANGETVVVLEEDSKDLPGFSRLYRPPGVAGCERVNGYFVKSTFLKDEDERSPSSLREDLFVSKPFTEKKAFTFGIEGPAVDGEGNLYVVNFARQGTIGVVSPNGTAAEFTALPEGSVANSIQISRSGEMFVADYKKHNVFKIDMKTKKIEPFVSGVGMSQPNDLALSSKGVLYASDPDWKKGTGRVWRIDPTGAAKVVAEGDLGTVNGLDLSPDEKVLYVGDSKTRKIWAYEIKGDELGARRLVTQFPDFEIDGLKVDSRGDLYVARIGKGTIAKISPRGALSREIKLGGAHPTNLVFGGPDRRTVFVTQRDGGFVESFRVDAPGR